MSKKGTTKLNIIKVLVFIGCFVVGALCHVTIVFCFTLCGITLGGIPTFIIVAVVYGATFKLAKDACASVEKMYKKKHKITAIPNEVVNEVSASVEPPILKTAKPIDTMPEGPAPQERAPEAPAAIVAPAAVTKTESEKKSKLQSIIIAVLAVLLCVSVVFNISQTFANESLKADIQALQETIEKNKSNMAVLGNQNNQLKETMSELKEYKSDTEKEIEFFEENIGFINTDDAYYYHSYSCPLFNKYGKYWAYNNENAKYQGYVPCPYCH